MFDDVTAAADESAEFSQDATAGPTVNALQTHQVLELKTASPLIACRFDPLGRYVFAAGEDCTICRWSVEGGEPVVLAGHESWTRGLAFSPDGARLYSGGYEGRLIAWPTTADAPQPAWSIEAHDGWLRGVATSYDGQLVATCGNDHLVKLWNAADGSPVAVLRGHEHHVYSVAFHPDGASLVSGDLKGVLRHWDLATHSQPRQFDAGKLWKYDEGFRADIGGTRSMAFSPDGRLLAVSGITNVSNAFAGVGNPLVVLLDWEGGEPIQALASKEGIQGVLWGVVVHADGFVVGASGGQGGGNLFFWWPDSPDEFHKLKLPHTARDLALHPDGLTLAAAHYDRHLRLYRMTAPAEVADQA